MSGLGGLLMTLHMHVEGSVNLLQVTQSLNLEPIFMHLKCNNIYLLT